MAQIQALPTALDRPLSDAASVRAAARLLDAGISEVIGKTRRVAASVRKEPLSPPKPLTDHDWDVLDDVPMHASVRAVINHLRDSANKGVHCTDGIQTRVNSTLITNKVPYRLLKKRRVKAETDFEGGKLKLYHMPT